MNCAVYQSSFQHMPTQTIVTYGSFSDHCDTFEYSTEKALNMPTYTILRQIEIVHMTKSPRCHSQVEIVSKVYIFAWKASIVEKNCAVHKSGALVKRYFQNMTTQTIATYWRAAFHMKKSPLCQSQLSQNPNS